MSRVAIALLAVSVLALAAGCGGGGTSSPADAALPGDAGALDGAADGMASDGPLFDAAPADTAAPTDAGPDAVGQRPCTLGGDECLANERCLPAGPNESLICRPVGTVAIGDPCGTTGVDDCVAGAVCVDYTATLSICERLCGDSYACPQAHEVCVPWFGLQGTVAGICLGDDCTPPASGCGAEERCTVLWSEEAFYACVPAGSVPVGGDCSVDECVAGALCVGSGGSYTCLSFCNSGAECVEADLHCTWPWPEIPDMGRCAEGCDPVRQTGCTPGNACYFLDPEIGTTDCFPEGSLAPGANCSDFSQLCEGGYDCVLEPSTDPHQYYCRAYCDSAEVCATGTCELTQATPALKFCMP